MSFCSYMPILLLGSYGLESMLASCFPRLFPRMLTNSKPFRSLSGCEGAAPSVTSQGTEGRNHEMRHAAKALPPNSCPEAYKVLHASRSCRSLSSYKPTTPEAHSQPCVVTPWSLSAAASQRNQFYRVARRARASWANPGQNLTGFRIARNILPWLKLLGFTVGRGRRE